MEIADAFVVNKADRPQADRMVKELKEMVGLASHFTDWEPPVLKAQGNAAKGVKELFDAILAHGEFLKKNKKDSLHHNLSHGVLELLTEKVSQKWKISLDAGRLDKTLQRLADKKINPYQAVDQSFKVILDK